MFQTSSGGGIRAFLTWVWAGALIVFGGLYLILNTGLLPADEWRLPLMAVSAAAPGIPFLGRWLFHRREWWALLAAWVFFSLASLIAGLFLIPSRGEIVLAIGLLEVALPFLAVYLIDRSRRWALISACVLLVLAALTGLAIGLSVPPGWLIGGALLAAALPLWLVFAINRQARWALIAAVALSGAAAGGAAFLLLRSEVWLFYVILYVTLAVICLAVWRVFRRLNVLLWLAAGFGVAGILAIRFPPSTGGAILALTVGLYLIARQVGRSRRASPAARPVSPPPSPTPSPPSSGASPQKPAMPPAGTGKGQPVSGFRPIDPFRGRSADDEP